MGDGESIGTRIAAAAAGEYPAWRTLAKAIDMAVDRAIVMTAQQLGAKSRQTEDAVGDAGSRQELIDKVSALVVRKYGGKYREAFDAYDADSDGRISVGELQALLADAGIGPRWAWRVWARGIMEALDADDDGRIGWAEFELVLSGGGA